MVSRFTPSLSTSTLLLRIALGITFVWFGALKLSGMSPVEPLIRASYSFIPYEPFQLFIGLLEVVIGLGFIIGKKMYLVVLLMFLQMGGVFTSVFLAPDRFFQNGNLFTLTLEGEFMVKNLVLISAGLVVLSVHHHTQNTE